MNTKAQKSPGFNSDQELAKFLLSNLASSLKEAVKVTVRIMFKQEMEDFRQKINEQLSFNGYYQRNMTSPLGKIDNIDVPRFREKQQGEMNLQTNDVFNQEKDKFLNIVAEMHRLGISQRKVSQLCQACFGVKVNKNKVGLVHKELAQEESLRINQQKLADEFDYLLLDGTWAKCKNYGLNKDNQTVLLCALGITAAGKRKIIGFQIAFRENYENWSAFLQDLKQRGLTGHNLKLIITDDNGGLTKAVKHLYPQKPLQVCVAHKMRNVMSKTRHRNKKALGQDLKVIYRAQTKKEAQSLADKFAKKWFVAEEAAVRSLRFDFEKTLTYFNYPEDTWKKIRTTNILEREFREVKRRIKVFDNSFNHQPSMENYANTIFNDLNNHYPALHTKS